jgi:hypothetical protein
MSELQVARQIAMVQMLVDRGDDDPICKAAAFLPDAIVQVP